MKSFEPPKIEIKKPRLTETWYRRGDDHWDVPTLIREVEEQKLLPFDMPIAGICLDPPGFLPNSFFDFVSDMKRVLDADMKYPIILDDTGYVCDGWHRLAKAIFRGDKYIKAVRLLNMPTPSNTKTQE